ncbi:MAG: hypothetical protein ACW986_09010 [Promethearchaeota archaeon]
MNTKLIKRYCLILAFIIFIISFPNIFRIPFNPIPESEDIGPIRTSGEQTYIEEWIKNNNFTTQDYWFVTKGEQGDNSTVDAFINSEQGNFRILGEELNYTLFGTPNSTESPEWYEFAKPDYYLPDNTAIDSYGCRVSHTWAEGSNQFPGVHWRKNISIQEDMSDYSITSADLRVLFNASVATISGNGLDGIDVSATESDTNQFGIGDFITFYVMISDIDFKNPYIVAFNRTTDLGQDSPAISNISDSLIFTYDEDVIITALNSAFEKDIDHSNFTITLGIDIYAEDNWGSDRDVFNYIYFKDCNFTFNYERKIEQFSSVSWNQVGSNISGENIRIDNANLKFKYKVDQQWPTNLSAFSEIRILLNDNPHTETVSLSTANLTFGDAKAGGFDITNLILKDVNITLSIQVFIGNTFGFDQNLTISIDDISLVITYVETVPDIPTVLDLFLNGDNKTSDPIIIIPYGEQLNITIKYLVRSTRLHILNASVQLSGKISKTIPENTLQNHYNITIDTTLLGVGIQTFTILAQKNLYENQELQFFVEVTERETSLELYLDSMQKADRDTIQVEVDDIINVTVYYKDNITELSGATVSISGIGDMNETINGYYISISANELDQKVNSLIINAQLLNYTPQTIQFIIEIIERETDLQLYLNGDDKTTDPSLELPISLMLNITVRFQDSTTGVHIINSSVQLEGDPPVLNFTENLGLNQYTLIVNTSALNIGVNLFRIVAYEPNYEIQTINLRIIVNKINAIISTESGIPSIGTIPGQNVVLRVNLTNTDFGGFITGALVSYGWAYGQGNLTDLDNDGIYEGLIDGNVPIGTYIITLTAIGDENINFESYEIILTVSKPEAQAGQTWIVYVLIALIIGVVSVFTAYQTHFKYPPLMRKVRKLRKKIRKDKKKIKPLVVPNREEILQTRFKNQSSQIGLETEVQEIKDYKN